MVAVNLNADSLKNIKKESIKALDKPVSIEFGKFVKRPMVAYYIGEDDNFGTCYIGIVTDVDRCESYTSFVPVVKCGVILK